MVVSCENEKKVRAKHATSWGKQKTTTKNLHVSKSLYAKSNHEKLNVS